MKMKTTKDCMLELSREFDAPRPMVFDAWTTPEKIGTWWGPEGFTTTTHSMNFREGGTWDYIMHGPDGTDYDNFVRYTRIKEPQQIAYEHGENEKDGPLFNTRVLFEDLGTKTRVTLRLIFPTKEARDATVEKAGAVEGGRQTLQRLANYVERINS